MKFSKLQELVEDLHFDLLGVAEAALLEKELEDFKEWLANKYHGDMKWLEKDPQRRCDPSRVVDDCQSLIITGISYHIDSQAIPSLLKPGEGRISKYAQFRDYHRVFEKKLKSAARLLQQRYPENTFRYYVDYGPVMERAWAERARLGFRGKHTLLIHPDKGSYFLLGCILSDLPIENDMSAEFPDITASCGNCRRCIDACPTDAITAPYQLDATRCLSYLTIEKDGPIKNEFWDRFAGNFFGCDICQDVCPYNQSRSRPKDVTELGEPIVGEKVKLADWIRNPEKELEKFDHISSPLKRAGAHNLARNAAILSLYNGSEDTLSALREAMEDQKLPDWLRLIYQVIVDQNTA